MPYIARPLELPRLAPDEFCERERRNANIYERQTENINIYKPPHTETLVAIPTKLPTAAFLCLNLKKLHRKDAIIFPCINALPILRIRHKTAVNKT